jgi:hypothetical protein
MRTIKFLAVVVPHAPRRRVICIALMAAGAGLMAATSQANAQLPKSPQNLQVLPKELSTSAVFTIMLDMAGALGVTCGSCHPGGDNPTWDSTNFTGDVKPMKATAREMFRLTKRLNDELLPATVRNGVAPVPVTCATCHRGASRPVAITDTIFTVFQTQGADSAIAEYRRIREQYAGRMTFDLTDYPFRVVVSRVIQAGRVPDAIKLLEFGKTVFPDSKGIDRDLAKARQVPPKSLPRER